MYDEVPDDEITAPKAWTEACFLLYHLGNYLRYRSLSMSTLFTKIIRREIPSAILHEDDMCIVILDLFPINKGHALVISKNEYETILECPQSELSYLMDVARQAAAKMTSELSIDGFNIMINNKPASGQEVPHLHIHIIPRYSGDGKTPIMAKEEYLEGEMESLAERLSF